LHGCQLNRVFQDCPERGLEGMGLTGCLMLGVTSGKKEKTMVKKKVLGQKKKGGVRKTPWSDTITTNLKNWGGFTNKPPRGTKTTEQKVGTM